VSRERILSALGRAAGRGSLPLTPVAPPPAPAPARGDLLERFAAELEALGGRFHRPATEARARELVVELSRREGPWPVLSWAPDSLPLPGLWPALEEAGLQPLQADLPREPEARAARLERLGEARTGLTGVDAALAETGGLLLASGSGRSRLAWLLPERHVALLQRAVLRFDLAEVVSERPELLDAGAGVALVAGPSRTADIELTLTRGVHGPRHVDVILLP
jgi:L-lactate dehydrogenase complex protein LldG